MKKIKKETKKLHTNNWVCVTSDTYPACGFNPNLTFQSDF